MNDDPRFTIRKEFGSCFVIDGELPPYRRFALALECGTLDQAGRVALALNRFYMQEGSDHAEDAAE